MKRFNIFFIIRLLCLILLFFSGINAYAGKSDDSITISLLTCQPHQEVYSLYGHTAIRYQDKAKGIDLAINYGMFNFNKPYFILRFIFGLTDYEMGIETFEDFCLEYSSYGCGVIEQDLNLTSEEKNRISKAIEINALPKNRIYRYNYFYDNCTTRARDILINNVYGDIKYDINPDFNPSYREMIHYYNTDHPWARFGNDLLLGIKSDLKTNYNQQQFLPLNLKKDFDKAVIVNPNGTKRYLVSKTFWVINPQTQIIKSEFPLTPTECAIIFAIFILTATIFECFYNRNIWLIDCLLLIIDGIAGMILFVMIFSQHPSVSLNFQILLLNPLSLIFSYKVIMQMRKKNIHWWLKVWIISIMCFLIGGIFQDYADGMNIVAWSLLFRYCVKIYEYKKLTKYNH